MTLTLFYFKNLYPELIIHDMDLLMNMCFTSQAPTATSVRNPYVTEQQKLQSKPSAGKMVSPKYSIIFIMKIYYAHSVTKCKSEARCYWSCRQSRDTVWLCHCAVSA